MGKVKGDEAKGLTWSKMVKTQSLCTRLKIRFYISWDEVTPQTVFNQGNDITTFMSEDNFR